MKLWLRMAFKEILINRRFSIFFILNMSIGLAGFIAINSFSTSLSDYMAENLKEILTADFVIVSNRPLTDDELQVTERVLGPEKTQSEQIVFYSMVKGNDISRLAQIIAIDDTFPLYGRFHLEKPEFEDKVNRILSSGPDAIMMQDTASSFNLHTGDHLQIGDKSFRVNHYFTKDPDKAVTSIELAPRIYIGLSQLEGTGLVKFGSRISYIRYYRYPELTDIASITDKLKKEYTSLFQDEPDIYVMDSRDVNRRLGRIIKHFTGYMGLVGIVALFLAGIATAYLFRGYLNLKLNETAILMSIGAVRFQTYTLFLLQLIFLGFCASCLSILFALLILPVFPLILQGIVPENLTVAADIGSTLTALAMGVGGSIIFCLPVFIQIHSVKPLMLLRNTQIHYTTLKLRLMRALSLLPAILSFLFLSVYLTGSMKRGLIFTTGFLSVMLILGAVGILIFRSCRRFSDSHNIIRKISFRNLYRNKLSSVSCFVTIAMGAFLINMIPQIQQGLQNEIARPEGLKIPVYFLIDIQDEQLEPLQIFLEENKYQLTNVSPVVRGRISTVNGTGFYKRREKDKKTTSRRRFRRVEFMFSSRMDLDVSEQIIEGKQMSRDPWSYESDHPFEISMAEHFAERHELKMGDVMEFDIQGIPFTGKIVNIRKVQWNSFQPNFFLLFQNGVLDDAPKTYLASIPQVPLKDRRALKNKLFERFSNISVLDVTQTVTQILGITDKLSFSIKFMAYLAIAAGLVSIFSIARHEAQKHEKEINLLKVLGAGFSDIRKIIILEFGFLGFMSALFSIFLSIIFSYGVSYLFFDRLWSFRWEYSLFILVATTLICIFTAIIATEQVIKKKAVSLLGAG